MSLSSNDRNFENLLRTDKIIAMSLVHNTVVHRQFFLNILLPPDQHHISDVAKWR